MVPYLLFAECERKKRKVGLEKEAANPNMTVRGFLDLQRLGAFPTDFICCPVHRGFDPVFGAESNSLLSLRQLFLVRMGKKILRKKNPKE